MKSIVICGSLSSAALYMEDVLKMGLNPIIVNNNYEGPLKQDEEKFFRAFGDGYPVYHAEISEIPELAEKLKGEEIIAVVAGCELGVRSADLLANELGLLGNDPATTHCRCTKKGMFDSLDKAGVRRIETALINSDDDIKRFWKEKNITIAFMKYSESAGSVGNKVCETMEEAIEHYHKMLDADNPFLQGGLHNQVLLQEYIGGDEYIVNSVSCNGQHLITDIWKYSKIRTDDNNVVYDSARLLMSAEPGIQDLVHYAYKVLDATGFKYGPCHGEYKIDSKGPVLIETNARPMGASMRSSFLDECLGHHITDISLDSYLDPARFKKLLDKPYEPRKMGLIFLPIVPHDIDADMAPLFELVKNLKTFRYTDPASSPGVVHYPKTVDLETTPIQIKLCGKPEDVLRDVDFLHNMEFNYFDLLFALNETIPQGTRKIDIKDVLAAIDRVHKTLVVMDDGNMISQFGETRYVSENKLDIYDVCVFDKFETCTLMQKYRDLIIAMAQLRDGGYVVILPEAYENMPFGSVSIELLMKLSGVKLELPSQRSSGILYGRKR